MAFQKETLVLGSGPCADQVAARLSAHGIAVRQATMGGADGVPSTTISGGTADQPLSGVQLVGCRGQAGEFRVTLADNEKRSSHKVSSIVLAQACKRVPNHDVYSLAPSERVMALSAIEDAVKDNAFTSLVSSKAQVVFLNSWGVEPHPVVTQAMLQRCLELQKRTDARTYFLCGNLKVSANGMEACYEEAKTAGTVFLKFTRRLPVLARLDDGRVQIDYWDETTRMDFRIKADLIIVDEQIVPHPELTQVIQRLRLVGDAFGFAQDDNVHRLANFTNRRGIFVAGGARAILSDAEQMADADQAALHAIEFISDLDRAPLPLVEIDQGRCARCLTCYRLCPYAAVEMAPRMTIHAAACQSCGLCAAGCPNRAIRIQDPELEKMLKHPAGQGGAAIESDGFVSKIVVFCCSRSAVQARDLAKASGLNLPAGLLFAEGVCGGTFSVHHLLSAIDAGMDGVLVLTCHEGNCHSGRGTQESEKRVAETIRLLAWAGVTAERVQFNTLAANMGSEFAQIVNGFSEKIKTLGPVMG